jgi:hypothetical protein
MGELDLAYRTLLSAILIWRACFRRLLDRWTFAMQGARKRKPGTLSQFNLVGRKPRTFEQ